MEKPTTAKQVTNGARIIGCHPETLRRLERRGLIKAKRDYRGWRLFELEDLLNLKAKREKVK